MIRAFNKKLIYAVACGVILALLFVITYLFYLKPFIKNYVAHRALKYHIILQPNNIGLAGTIELKDQNFKLDKATNITIQKAIIRPPLPFLSGFVEAQNVTITYKDYIITIPKVKLNNITKNHSVSNKLDKYNIGSIFTPYLKISNENKQSSLDIHNIYIDNLAHGIIEALTFDRLHIQIPNLNINLSATKLKALNIKNIININKGGKTSSLWKYLHIKTFWAISKKDAKHIISLKSQNIDSSELIVQPFNNNINNINRLDIAKHIQKLGLVLYNLIIHSSEGALTLHKLALEAQDWQKIIPYNFLLTFNKINLTNLPAQQASLINNIYKNMEISGAINFNYDLVNKYLKINNLDLNINNQTKLHIKCDLSNINENLFDGELLTQNNYLHKLDLIYYSKTPLDAIASWLSAKGDITIHDTKNLIYTILQKSPALLLNNKNLGDVIGNKLVDIAQKPQDFALEINSKDKKGVALSEFLNDNNSLCEELTKKINLHIKTKYL